ELGRYVRAYGGYRKVGEAVGVNSKYVGLLVRGQAAPSVLIANELATVLGMDDGAKARLVSEAREGRGYDREGTARRAIPANRKVMPKRELVVSVCEYCGAESVREVPAVQVEAPTH